MNLLLYYRIKFR